MAPEVMGLSSNPEPVKGPYRSPLREQAARRTRTQIRDAAPRLIQQGYARITMRQIADSAEVSERTAYLAFPSRLDLFMEVIGVATAGDAQPIPIAERPEFQPCLHATARRPWHSSWPWSRISTSGLVRWSWLPTSRQGPTKHYARL